MSYVLLRRTILVNNTGVGAPFVATEVWYDDVKRKPFARQFDSQTNDPFELAKDTEVSRYTVRNGLQHLVKYNGNGSVYTEPLRQASTGIGTALKLKLIPESVGATDQNASDACFDLTGQFGLPPYQLEVTGQRGNANGYYKTAVSQLEIYPVRFYNLATGEYFLKVTDATGDFRTQLLTIGVAPYGYPRGTSLADAITAGRLFRRWWLSNELRVELRNYSDSQGTTNFTLPYGTPVDAYLLPGSNGATWRQVYADGIGGVFEAGVYFVDTSTAATSSLELDNIIQFNPDTTAEQNGGALIEVQGGVMPLSFTLTGAGVTQTNATGIFDGLAAGTYSVVVRDALAGKVSASFMLEDRYRLWRYTDYDDYDGTPMRVEFWRRDYAGAADTICLTDQAVVISSDGLAGEFGGQGDLPPLVGTSAEVNVLAEPDLFEPIVLGDDRNCRVDYYHNGLLHFRGYVKPNIFTQPLLGGLQPTTVIATDGLASLKNEDMRGHIGQRLGGHRPVLNTLLHCLSRCQIALPVQIFTNRRDVAMATMDAPELVTTTNRTGYYDAEKDEADNQYSVVNALGQLLGGTLVQRQGTWQLRSAQEAAVDAPGRAYRPAGTPVGDVVALAPSGTILPPGPARWHWLEASQTKQVRPGWKSLIGTTNAGWLENAFWQGEVFNDEYAWLDDYSKLRGTNGWYAPPGKSFPLVLQRVGEKGKDHSTLWPRSTAFSLRDGRFLISPPLPLAAGLEAVPAVLRFTGKLVPADYYLDYDSNAVAMPTTAAKAYLPYEVLIDGHSTGIQLAEFVRVEGSNAKDTVFEVELPPLPSQALGATMQVYSWHAPDTNLFRDAAGYSPFVSYKKGDVVRDYYAQGQNLFVARRDQATYPSNQPPAVFLPPAEWAPVEATDRARGNLLITSVGIQLRPQGATWEAEDNFRADGPGGTVRPTEPLKVYHPDVPIDAGLFAGNLYAFGKGVGNTDGVMTTSWARAIDLDAAPLLQANVFDGLALRANNARLLTGVIRHKSILPPYLLDSVDAPTDVPGRRFFVGSTTWRTRAAETEVSLIEIGPSNALVVQWPSGARIVHQAYLHPSGVYLPYLRAARGGRIRARHP